MTDEETTTRTQMIVGSRGVVDRWTPGSSYVNTVTTFILKNNVKSSAVYER